MVELLLALLLIVVLHWRTLSYKNLIDDIVPMKDYLYVVPQTTPAPEFHLQTTPRPQRLWAVAVHCINTILVYLILGGKAALLFAVFPVSVNNTAWITGSYYSTTTFLTLAAYYFLTKTVWFIGVPFALLAYAAALNSTIVAITFPFIAVLAAPFGWTMFFPLVMFLIGKRFTSGKKIRELPSGSELPGRILPDIFTYRRLALMTKVVGLYLYTALVPLKLCFFRKFGEVCRFNKAELDDLESFNGWFFGALALIGAFLATGFYVGKGFWALWFLVFISAFSNFRMLGQFFAERYVYPASVGLAALTSCLPTEAFWVLVGLYTMRTHMFIPVFENNKTLYLNGIQQDPKEAINYCNLSDWYLMVERDLGLAGYYIQVNMQKDPADYKPHVNFASLWRMLNNVPMAVEHGRLAKQKAEGRCFPHTMRVIDSQLEMSERILNENPQK